MPTLTEPEISLLRQWHSFVDPRQAVKWKYEEILKEVLVAVQDKHKELTDRRDFHLDSACGPTFQLGKKTWSRWSGRPSPGFMIGDISLENLLSDDGNDPHKFVIVSYRPNDAVDLAESERSLCAAAKRILTKDELTGMQTGPEWLKAAHVYPRHPVTVLSWPITKLRADFLDLLIKDDARGLVECMAGHFESLVKFTPVLDEVYEAVKLQSANSA